MHESSLFISKPMRGKGLGDRRRDHASVPTWRITVIHMFWRPLGILAPKNMSDDDTPGTRYDSPAHYLLNLCCWRVYLVGSEDVGKMGPQQVSSLWPILSTSHFPLFPLAFMAGKERRDSEKEKWNRRHERTLTACLHFPSHVSSLSLRERGEENKKIV